MIPKRFTNTASPGFRVEKDSDYDRLLDLLAKSGVYIDQTRIKRGPWERGENGEMFFLVNFEAGALLACGDLRMPECGIDGIAANLMRVTKPFAIHGEIMFDAVDDQRYKWILDFAPFGKVYCHLTVNATPGTP